MAKTSSAQPFPGTVSDVSRCETVNTPVPGIKMPAGTNSMPPLHGPDGPAAKRAHKDAGIGRTAALRWKDET